MPKKFIGLLVLAGFAGLLLIPTFGPGEAGGHQPGGKKGGKKGGGGFDPNNPGGGKKGKKGQGQGNNGFNAMNMGPDMIFNQMAGGRDAIIINNAGMMRPSLEQWAMDNGNNSGVISREEFMAFYPSMMASMMGGPRSSVGAKSNFDAETMAQQRFARLDKNSDGYLNEDEIPATMKAVWQLYDTNKDGLIDYAEYKVFFDQTVSGGSGIEDVMSVMVDDWEKRPTVFRAGKLPPELPAWFKQLDRDGDGQVGMYEWWNNSGKSLAEFQAMDRNGDGLLTAEEVLWYMKKVTGTAGGSLADYLIVQAVPGASGFNPSIMFQQNNMKGKKGKGGSTGGAFGSFPGAGVKGGGKGGKGGGGGFGGFGGGQGGFGGPGGGGFGGFGGGQGGGFGGPGGFGGGGGGFGGGGGGFGGFGGGGQNTRMNKGNGG